jgi:putative FmdB family regulatory protein
MPIYEYRCAACGHELDALQKISDAPLRKCPECGKSMLKRLVSAPSFRLKGSGWYETDFKNNGEKKRNLVEAASSEPSDKAGETKPADRDGAAKEATSPAKADGEASGAAKPAAKDKPAPSSKARSAKKRAPRATRSA